MPWTRKEVKYLLSSGSPLTAKQTGKMKSELHANPEMGHMRKHSGFQAVVKSKKKKHG